jgi:trimeric autotransporter adhesin
MKRNLILSTLFFLLWTMPAAVLGETYTVNTTNNNDDGTCDVVHCSLMEAINAAATHVGPHTIAFNIPLSDPGYNAGGWWTIQPAAGLEIPIDTILDGTTQTAQQGDTNPNGPEIEIDGSALPSGVTLMRVGNKVTVRGVVIYNAPAYDIWVEGANIVIAGNYIGTDPTAKEVSSNSYDKILIIRAQNSRIGGTDPSDANTIASAGNCIRISNSMDTKIIGNFIGTDASGTKELGCQMGVDIHAGAQNNTLGPDNVIAFNRAYGVQVWEAGTLSNTITSNRIYSNTLGGIALLAGGNGELAGPVISKATGSEVVGTACTNCRIEIFSDEEEEGHIYEGFVMANSSGEFAFSKLSGLTGPYVTATATDDSGNTSEFSKSQKIAQVRIYIPLLYKNP